MDRAGRVAARLAGEQVDALIVTNLVNVRYLTGFTGSNALCVVGPQVRRFATDFRYVERAAAEVEGFDREAPPELYGVLEDGWPAGTARVGFEEDHLTVRQHRRMRERVPEGVELVGVSGLVEAERAVKDADELARIAAAAELADDALREILEGALAGRTERDVALALEQAMRRRGGEPAFSTIVASGTHGALPHASPRPEAIPPDVLVTIDFGVRLDAYCSDCTRTFATGEVGEDLRAIYDLVERAQAAALEAVRPGLTGREVDAVARDLIEAAGHAEHFGHGTGHGVGLEVHEGPRLARSGEDVLQAGNVVTVEPGVYVPGRGGVRIEDLVAVTDDGGRSLSSLPKALTVI